MCSVFLVFVVLALVGPALQAQQLTLADYQKADLIRTTTQFVGGEVTPAWLADSVRFYYRSNGATDRGTVYLVDPIRKTRQVLFDRARTAAALSVAADTVLDPDLLPSFTYVEEAKAIEFRLKHKDYSCHPTTYVCVARDTSERMVREVRRRGPIWAVRSPDGQWDAFVYNQNVYVRPAALSIAEAEATRDSLLRVAAEKEVAKRDPVRKGVVQRGPMRRDSAWAGSVKPEIAEAGRDAATRDSMLLPKGAVALTTDGGPYYAYGSMPSVARGSTIDSVRHKPFSSRALVWSPDSRKLAVHRADIRNVRKYPLYSSTTPQPTDKSYRFAAPGDTAVPQYETYVLDVRSRTSVKVQDAPIVDAGHTTHGVGLRWGRTSDKLFMLHIVRGAKRIKLSVVDTRTGMPTLVVRDSIATYLEIREVNWRVLNDGADILWYSQRDGWGHLYRYAGDGTLQNQIESGPYAVARVERVDSIKRQVYFTGWGKAPGVPYYGHLYRVDFDGSGLIDLTPEDGDHQVSFTPKANYFIDTHARPDMAPVTYLRRGSTGEILLTLSKGDTTLLRSVGWSPPEVFKVKARNGITELWGLVYKPSYFDSTKQYPIIDNIYPGPQTGSVPSWGFGYQGDARALAELGFIVIQLDHMGTPGRSKAFHDFYVGNMGDNGIPDHVAAIRQLAARHPWIDINRVGIYGTSGGGFASTAAMLRYPDFFKVAVSSAGNHDNRTFGYFWGERYQGLLAKDPMTGKDNYEASANYTLAGNLKGKLLLMHGDLDATVHPANTLRVVHELIKANKDFDMIIFPDAGHALPEYSIRKLWDYFVRHLSDREPPAGYRMMKGLAQ